MGKKHEMWEKERRKQLSEFYDSLSTERSALFKNALKSVQMNNSTEANNPVKEDVSSKDVCPTSSHSSLPLTNDLMIHEFKQGRRCTKYDVKALREYVDFYEKKFPEKNSEAAIYLNADLREEFLKSLPFAEKAIKRFYLDNAFKYVLKGNQYTAGRKGTRSRWAREFYFNMIGDNYDPDKVPYMVSNFVKFASKHMQYRSTSVLIYNACLKLYFSNEYKKRFIELAEDDRKAKFVDFTLHTLKSLYSEFRIPEFLSYQARAISDSSLDAATRSNMVFYFDASKDKLENTFCDSPYREAARWYLDWGKAKADCSKESALIPIGEKLAFDFGYSLNDREDISAQVNVKAVCDSVFGVCKLFPDIKVNNEATSVHIVTRVVNEATKGFLSGKFGRANAYKFELSWKNWNEHMAFVRGEVSSSFDI